VRVKKNDVVSNKMTLTVTAASRITSAKIKKDTVVIKGADFGKKPGEVLLDDSPVKIRCWSNKKIVANIPADTVAGQTIKLVNATGAVGTVDIAAVTTNKGKTKLKAQIRH